MQTHFQERNLKDHEAVRVFFAINSGRKAIVFVHGYGGDPIGTWSDFHVLLPSRPEASSHDLMFYGYDGLRAELIASSTLFQQFLRWIFTVKGSTLNESLPRAAPRDEEFSYDEVIVVAHSLGAVIARWALLQATNEEENWASKIKLVLFAPAHRGANVVKLASEVLGGFRFLSLFSSFARFQSPLIDQLHPDSSELRTLHEGTERALNTGRNAHLVPRKVIIAEYERIVSNLPFSNRDPAPLPFRGTEHTTVCKPKLTFLDPVEVVLECL